MGNLRVKEILKERGLTQKQLADMIDIAEISLSRSINGNPTLDTLQKIASALDVDIIELFTHTTNSTNGYIEHNGEIHKINSIEDIRKLLSDIDNRE